MIFDKVLNLGVHEQEDINRVRLYRQVNGLNLFYTFVAFSVGILSFTALGKTNGGRMLGYVQIIATLFYASNLIWTKFGKLQIARQLTIHIFEWHLFLCALFTGLWYSPVLLVIVLFPLLAALVEVSIIVHLFIGLFQFVLALLFHFLSPELEAQVIEYMGLAEDTSIVLKVMGLFYFPLMAAGIIKIIFNENLRARSKLKDMFQELEQTHKQLKSYANQLKDESIRLKAELKVARDIQLMVLPSEEFVNSIDELDISGSMYPADEVGGDYYDVFHTSDGKLLFGIGDVTGHGLSSGLIMLMAQTAIQTLGQIQLSGPKDYLPLLNDVLYSNIKRINEERNMTLSLLQYDGVGNFEIAGQHESYVIIRENGDCEICDTMNLGFFIGMMEDINDTIETETFFIGENDILFLYTDGVTEAENMKGEQFGQYRMISILKKFRDLPAAKIKERFMRKLYNYIGENSIYDDISILVIKRSKGVTK